MQQNRSSVHPLPAGSRASVATIKLTYSSSIPPDRRPVCSDSESAYQIFSTWWDSETLELYETFAVLLLDRQHRVIGLYEHSRGGTSATVFDPKLIMSAAILSRAEGIVLAHNHPSGMLSPSSADILLTKRLTTVATLHHIPVQDHLLLSPWGGYYSFAASRPQDLKEYNLAELG